MAFFLIIITCMKHLIQLFILTLVFTTLTSCTSENKKENTVVTTEIKDPLPSWNDGNAKELHWQVGYYFGND